MLNYWIVIRIIDDFPQGFIVEYLTACNEDKKNPNNWFFDIDPQPYVLSFNTLEEAEYAIAQFGDCHKNHAVEINVLTKDDKNEN